MIRLLTKLIALGLLSPFFIFSCDRKKHNEVEESDSSLSQEFAADFSTNQTTEIPSLETADLESSSLSQEFALCFIKSVKEQVTNKSLEDAANRSLLLACFNKKKWIPNHPNYKPDGEIDFGLDQKSYHRRKNLVDAIKKICDEKKYQEAEASFQKYHKNKVDMRKSGSCEDINGKQEFYDLQFRNDMEKTIDTAYNSDKRIVNVKIKINSGGEAYLEKAELPADTKKEGTLSLVSENGTLDYIFSRADQLPAIYTASPSSQVCDLALQDFQKNIEIELDAQVNSLAHLAKLKEECSNNSIFDPKPPQAPHEVKFEPAILTVNKDNSSMVNFTVEIGLTHDTYEMQVVVCRKILKADALLEYFALIQKLKEDPDHLINEKYSECIYANTFSFIKAPPKGHMLGLTFELSFPVPTDQKRPFKGSFAIRTCNEKNPVDETLCSPPKIIENEF